MLLPRGIQPHRRIQRLEQLKEWGFNVPFFIVNPDETHPTNTFICLRENEFMGSEGVVNLVVETPLEDRCFVALPLSDAVAMLLEFRKKRYRTMLLDHVSSDFSGVVYHEANSMGSVDVLPSKVSIRFWYPESLQDLKLRHIVRETGRLREFLNRDYYSASFLWAKDFSGVNQSKLVLYDYKILKKSA